MARGSNAYGLGARDRRFDSGCAARFFRYETSVMCHLQVESEGTAHFFRGRKNPGVIQTFSFQLLNLIHACMHLFFGCMESVGLASHMG